jgi:NTP pyrophosphatase (non-canonical NTP hydrolase)
MNKHQHDELLDAFGDVQVTLIILAAQLGVKYAQTLEDAYKVIADRQGKTIDGVFIKQAELRD